MPLVGEELDVEFQPNAWLAFHQHLRSGASRAAWPTLTRLEARMPASRTSSLVNLVRCGALQAHVRTVGVVPADGPVHSQLKRATLHRHDGQGWEAKDALSPGKHTLVFDFKYDGIGFGHGGEGTLKVDGNEVAKKKIARTLPFVLPEDETFDVGVDTRTPIDDNDYQVPFRFTGKLIQLTVELEPIKASLHEILEFKWKTRD
jgi:hypothetical protein